MMAEWDIIPPPNTMTVDHEHKTVLFTADGKALVRQAGFVTGGRMSQPSTVFPQLTKGGKKIGGKKGGGKRGC